MVTRTLFTIIALVVASVASGQTEGAGVVTNGTFARSESHFDPSGAARLQNKAELWDSWQGDDQHQGEWRYGPFVLDTKFALYMAGFPTQSGLEIAWEEKPTGRRLRIEPRQDPQEFWVLYQWAVPAEWRGRSVYLVASDHSTAGLGWLGVSRPVPVEHQFLPGLMLLGWHAGIFVLLLLPGFALIAFRKTDLSETPEHRLALVLIASATVAYALFFVFFASPNAGRVAVWLVVIGSAGWLVWRRKVLPLLSRELVLPLLVCFVAGWFYSSILLLYGGFEAPHTVAINRYLWRLPPDPLLPLLLSERIYAGVSPTPLMGDWLSSDRPPLQAAFHLLVSPFAPNHLGYQIVGTILQTWVFLGAWILLRFARITARTTAWVLFFAIFSGFVLLNGTYLWPKLLPAAFLLIAAALLLFDRRHGMLVGACAGLAMLGHGGSIFGLAGLAGCSAIWPPAHRFRYWATTVCMGVLWLAPWTLYQKLYDPPGNRLLKYHLAGVEPLDSRPLGQTLRDSYRGQTPTTLLENKWASVRKLWPDFSSVHEASNLVSAKQFSRAFLRVSYSMKEGSFFHLLQAPDVLLVGVFGFLFWRRIGERPPAERRLAKVMIVLVTFISVIWCALMFKPGSTVNHQGSYFTNLCLFIALSMGFCIFPSWLRRVVGTAALLWFGAFWIYSPSQAWQTPALLPSMDYAFATYTIIAGALIIALLVRVGNAPARKDSSETRAITPALNR